MSDLKKVKSTYYLPPDLDRAMRVEAAQQGLRYPSEFIIKLWQIYQGKKNDAQA